MVGNLAGPKAWSHHTRFNPNAARRSHARGHGHAAMLAVIGLALTLVASGALLAGFSG